MVCLSASEYLFSPAMVSSGQPYPVETERMTMQIGLVGSDGILLASDTCSSHEPEQVPQDMMGQIVRSTTSHSKIRIYAQSGIAISCADDMRAAIDVADAIVNSFQSNQPTDISEIEELTKSVAERTLSTNKRRIQCLIVLTRPEPQLFRLQYARITNSDSEWAASCEWSGVRSVAGDVTNPAVFWAERYHEPYFPIVQLIPLAAHLIESAHLLHNASIKGLEIVKCTAGGIEAIPRKVCEEWGRKALGWDRSICTMILKGEALSP